MPGLYNYEAESPDRYYKYVQRKKEDNAYE